MRSGVTCAERSDLSGGPNEQLNFKYIQALLYLSLPRRSISNYILYLYTRLPCIDLQTVDMGN